MKLQMYEGKRNRRKSLIGKTPYKKIFIGQIQERTEYDTSFEDYISTKMEIYRRKNGDI